MPEPQLISGLAEAAGRYDAVLCDVWGVIHNGRESFPAACQALERFQRERGPVVLVSNAPRPSDDVVSQLDQLGVSRAAWSGFVTSGDVTRTELKARAPGPAWAVGPARDSGLYEGTGVTFAEVPEQAAFVSCSGLFDDELETPDDYRARFEVCAARKLTMICANPDRVVQRGDKLIYCAGALADLYETMGGEVVMAGKPYAAIYEAALKELDRLAGRPIDPHRVLTIGDGVPTDVKGANAQGLDLLFVAAGIHAKDALGEEGELHAAKLDAFLKSEGVSADYAMAELAW